MYNSRLYEPSKPMENNTLVFLGYTILQMLFLLVINLSTGDLMKETMTIITLSSDTLIQSELLLLPAFSAVITIVSAGFYLYFNKDYLTALCQMRTTLTLRLMGGLVLILFYLFSFLSAAGLFVPYFVLS